MEDNFADVYPLAKKLEYMHALLELKPRTLLPITPQEEERILASLPSSTHAVQDHPIVSAPKPMALELHFNPYTHRFRRKLLLRQRQRQLAELGGPFQLESTVRGLLDDTELNQRRLSSHYPLKAIGNYVGLLPIQRSMPAPAPSKVKKSKEAMEEEKMERRRQSAQQRLPELPQTLAKLHQVQQRTQMMHTWIAQEDELAMRNLLGAGAASSSSGAADGQESHHADSMDITESSAGQSTTDANQLHYILGANGMSHTTSHASGREQQDGHFSHPPAAHAAPSTPHAAPSTPHPAPSTPHPDHAMDVTMELQAAHPMLQSAASELVPSASLSKPHQAPALPEISKTAPKQSSFNKQIERYSLASTMKEKTPSRADVALSRLRELNKNSSAAALHEYFNSAEMERYLAMTTQHIDALADNTVDPFGNSWSFEELMFGDIHDKRSHAHIVSPWSGRSLKPIIRRDYETEPPKLQLLREIEMRLHFAQPEWIAPPPAPIEYRYLRPYMLPQVNKLLQTVFWPEIDVSESLLYPEYSIVAMYKELVIGCAFITTLGYITYLCVHPDWRRSGIAKFMLYHLIQTSPGKDVTLHCANNNPALLLYQHFCFQTEELIKGFYDKYLPTNSSLSKDAFFMRLPR